MRISDWSSDVCSSDLWLDANTELHVGYRWWRRNVDVVRGQASFDVAHDAQRPFIVTAGGGIVTARGTRFNGTRMRDGFVVRLRSEEHTSELQSLMRISYAVFCLHNTKHKTVNDEHTQYNRQL